MAENKQEQIKSKIKNQIIDDIKRANKCLQNPDFRDYAIKIVEGKQKLERRIIKFVREFNIKDKDDAIFNLMEFKTMLSASEFLLDNVIQDSNKQKYFKGKNNNGNE